MHRMHARRFLGLLVGSAMGLGLACDSGLTSGADPGGDPGGDPGPGPNPLLCVGVDCSGKGACVPVDGVATCACDEGYYRVGLACLKDPCELGGTCYYVDAVAGNDANPGSRAEPWKSLDRVQTAMGRLLPGDYVLFRRDRSWADTETFRIQEIHGAAGEPITFGAYGEGSRPKFRAILPNHVSHVTLRDLESIGTNDGPCVSVTYSSFVTIRGMHAHDCWNSGLHFGAASSYGVLIDNRVWDMANNDALNVHSPTIVTETSKVGDHFWIVDNVVFGEIPEQPVDIATGNDDFDGSRDLKVVGNILTGGGRGCIILGHGSSVAWVVGNTLADCSEGESGFGIGLSGYHGERSGTDYHVAGNVIFHNLMSSIQIRGEDPAVPRASVRRNTMIPVIDRRAAVRSESNIKLVFDHNIVWPTGPYSHVQLKNQSRVHVADMDDNWYVPADDPGCKILGQSLVTWKASSGFDTWSRCEFIPGLSKPSVAEAADFENWTSPSFLSHFIPDPTWEGCADGIGAFACDGTRHIEFEPFSTYFSNGGLGWEGPLVVRQRYPLRD